MQFPTRWTSIIFVPTINIKIDSSFQVHEYIITKGLELAGRPAYIHIISWLTALPGYSSSPLPGYPWGRPRGGFRDFMDFQNIRDNRLHCAGGFLLALTHIPITRQTTTKTPSQTTPIDTPSVQSNLGGAGSLGFWSGQTQAVSPC